MRRVALLLMALGLVLPLGVRAQGKADFSGSWKFDATKSEPVRGQDPTYGPQGTGINEAPSILVVKQTPTELTIEGTLSSGPTKSVFRLDGTQTETPDPAGGRFAYRRKAMWDGARLTMYMVHGLEQVREIWTLNDGKLQIRRDIETPGSSGTRNIYYDKTSK